MRLFKRWMLLPPELTYLLYDRSAQRLAPDFTLHDIQGIDPADFPNLPLAQELALIVEQADLHFSGDLNVGVVSRGVFVCAERVASCCVQCDGRLVH